MPPDPPKAKAAPSPKPPAAGERESKQAPGAERKGKQQQQQLEPAAPTGRHSLSSTLSKRSRSRSSCRQSQGKEERDPSNDRENKSEGRFQLWRTCCGGQAPLNSIIPSASASARKEGKCDGRRRGRDPNTLNTTRRISYRAKSSSDEGWSDDDAKVREGRDVRSDTGGEEEEDATPPTKSPEEAAACVQAWLPYVHPRAWTVWGEAELRRVLGIVASSIGSGEDPILGDAPPTAPSIDAHHHISWLGDMSAGGLPVIALLKANETKLTITHICRFFVFTFGDDVTLKRLKGMGAGGFKMACGQLGCVKMSHCYGFTEGWRQIRPHR